MSYRSITMPTPDPKNGRKNSEDPKELLAKTIEKNPCSLCKTKGYLICKCVGGGGFGGDGGDGPAKTDDNVLADNASLEIAESSLEDSELFMELSPLEASWLERFSELLQVDNDSQRGILTLRSKPGLSPDELAEVEEFLNTVKAEFDQFKDDLEKQGIPVINFTALLSKNELVIRIPSPYYDAFIQQLVDKQLLPKEYLQQHEKVVSQQAAPNLSSPTPFATKPKPSMSKESDLKDKEGADAELFNPSPFSTVLKPRN